MIKYKSFTYNQLILIISICITISSATFLNSIRIPLIYTVGIISIVSMINKRKIRIKKFSPIILYCIFITLISCSILYSKDFTETLKYITIYVSCLFFLIKEKEEKFILQFIRGVEIIVFIIAISIILSAIFKSLMPNYLFFLVSKSKAEILKDISNGAFAGLAGDRAEAAVLMNIGLSIIWSNIITSKKRKNVYYIEMIVLYSALMLTGKRTLFVVAVILPIILIIFCVKRKKKIMVSSIVLIASIILLLSAEYIPALNNIFIRFQSTEDLINMNGRVRLWNVAKDMFENYPILGNGFGSFNLLANEAGIRLYNSPNLFWKYQAHNSYYQVFGELGIVGGVCYILFLISNCLTYFKLFKKKSCFEEQDFKIYIVSFYIFSLFVMYNFTGNCLYYANQIFIQCINISLLSYLFKKYRRTKIR